MLDAQRGNHAGFVTSVSSVDKVEADWVEADWAEAGCGAIRVRRTMRSNLKFRRSLRRWQWAISVNSPPSRRIWMGSMMRWVRVLVGVEILHHDRPALVEGFLKFQGQRVFAW